MSEPFCNGICVRAYELGVATTQPNGIVYPHPDCELHCPPDDKDDEK